MATYHNEFQRTPSPQGVVLKNQPHDLDSNFEDWMKPYTLFQRNPHFNFFANILSMGFLSLPPKNKIIS